MIIACVLKSGKEYNPTHVYNLRDMCRDFMPKHDFICLTDLSLNSCGHIPLDDKRFGWWSKLELFKFDSPDNRPVLYMDLDTVLVNDCTEVVEAAKGKPFIILRDPYRGYRLSPANRKAMGSGIMYWEADMHFLYDKYIRDADRIEDAYHGDQHFIEETLIGSDFEDKVFYWQDIVDGIVSYKADLLDVLGWKQIRGIDPTDKIVYFHGKPRPWEQDDVAYPTKKGMPVWLRKVP